MGAKVEASNTRSTEETNRNANYARETTFDPRADDVIRNLSGGLAGINAGGTDAAASFYRNQMNAPAGVNPYAQQVVDTQNRNSEADFQRRLSGVRSAGYNGGTGRDLVDQGMFASDFSNRQAAWNAQTLMDAFRFGEGQRTDAAGSLANIDNGRYATAINFINSLRGERGVTDERARTDGRSTTLSAAAGAGTI